MSHQVNYFLTPSDMELMFKRIKGVGSVYVLKSESPTSLPLVVPHEEFINERKWLFFSLVRPEDLPLLITKHIPTDLPPFWWTGLSCV